MKPECHMITEEYIQRNEGLRLKPYECSVGKLTIGYGRNIEDNGITEEEANIKFEHDLKIVADELREIFQSFDDLSYNRKKCLMDMCFNLGKPVLNASKKPFVRSKSVIIMKRRRRLLTVLMPDNYQVDRRIMRC
jgi:GH24 family phage-related lysozyme (muramidase)